MTNTWGKTKTRMSENEEYLLPPGPDPLEEEKTVPGDDELLSNSNCLERLREFQLKMHQGWSSGGGGPFALCINIPTKPNKNKENKSNCHLGGHGKVEEEVSSTIAQRQ